MISKLFRNRKSPPTAPPHATVGNGERIYAIGDIHGRADLLEDLLRRIEADDRARPPSHTTFIFLGDLVDRGPDSAQVVATLLDFQATRSAGSVRFVMGNHEEVFLTALAGDEKALRFFTRIGGRETIISYGIDEREYAEVDFPTLLKLLQAAIPPAHVEFLSGFEDMIIIGDYAFVHAGVRPDQPLNRQRIKDLRWIREDFVGFEGPLEKVIVHGHTISPDVEERAHRIGLDTGAFASGVLTAMGFENDQRWIIQAIG